MISGRRWAELEVREGATDDLLPVVASTDVAADMGGYREVLSHAPGVVDYAGARSVLLNHESGQLIGGIRKLTLEGGKLLAALEIDANARLQTGLNVREAVKRQYLKGVSIGYTYNEADATWTEKDGVRTVTVSRWRLLEITLTPTPADPAAEIRREFPVGIRQVSQEGGPTMGDTVKVPDPAPAVDELAEARTRAALLEKRLAQAEKETRVRALAEQHGLSCEKLDMQRSEVELQRDLMRQQAERKVVAVPDVQPKDSTAVVVQDASEKADAACSAALDYLLGDRKAPESPMRASSLLETGIRWAEARGVRSVRNAERMHLASALLGRGPFKHGFRGAPNVTMDQFSTYLLASAIDKALVRGFEAVGGEAVYPLISRTEEVVDFKTVRRAGLDFGDLPVVEEGAPFEEVLKGEGGWTGALEMHGVTLSLSLQALISDDLGEFMTNLGRAGAIAQRTIDADVVTKLEAASFSGATQTASSMDLAAATLDTARVGFTAKTGPGGKRLGNIPRILLVPGALRTTALQLTVGVQNATTFNTNTDLRSVINPYLANAGTGSQSSWYLVGDPNTVDGIVILKLRGMSGPAVSEFDAGAAAARKWKIMLPFKVVVPSALYGLYKATHS